MDRILVHDEGIDSARYLLPGTAAFYATKATFTQMSIRIVRKNLHCDVTIL
jgi:hypothetical protein